MVVAGLWATGCVSANHTAVGRRCRNRPKIQSGDGSFVESRLAPLHVTRCPGGDHRRDPRDHHNGGDDVGRFSRGEASTSVRRLRLRAAGSSCACCVASDALRADSAAGGGGALASGSGAPAQPASIPTARSISTTGDYAPPKEPFRPGALPSLVCSEACQRWPYSLSSCSSGGWGSEPSQAA